MARPENHSRKESQKSSHQTSRMSGRYRNASYLHTSEDDESTPYGHSRLLSPSDVIISHENLTKRNSDANLAKNGKSRNNPIIKKKTLQVRKDHINYSSQPAQPRFISINVSENSSRRFEHSFVSCGVQTEQISLLTSEQTSLKQLPMINLQSSSDLEQSIEGKDISVEQEQDDFKFNQPQYDSILISEISFTNLSTRQGQDSETLIVQSGEFLP